MAAQQLIQNKARREHIGRARGKAVRLLGSHEAQRARACFPGEVFIREAGDSEVADPDVIACEEKNIFGFHVAVDYFFRMSGAEPFEYLTHQAQGPIRPVAALDTLGEAFDARFVGEDKLAVDKIRVFEAEDVGMIQLGEHSRFELELVEELFVGGHAVGNLERDRETLDGIHRAPDIAEAPLTEPADQPVLAEVAAPAETKRSGFLVLEKLRRIHAEPIRVIMITANEGSRHKAYAEMLGVDDYIRKPFPMDRLVDSVQRLMA